MDTFLHFLKHALWVFVRMASVRLFLQNTHNMYDFVELPLKNFHHLLVLYWPNWGYNEFCLFNKMLLWKGFIVDVLAVMTDQTAHISRLIWFFTTHVWRWHFHMTLPLFWIHPNMASWRSTINTLFMEKWKSSQKLSQNALLICSDIFFILHTGFEESWWSSRVPDNKE